MNTEFTLTQKRALAAVTVIALLFGAYFLRHYFMLVVIAAIVAYLFTPLYNRCRGRFNTGLSATLTVLAALATVIAPVGALITVAVLQASQMVVHVADWVQTADLSTLGTQAIEFVNNLLAKLPFGHFSVTTESLRETMVSVSQNVGQWLLHSLTGAVGGVIDGVTSAIIFLYVLISLLTNQQALLTLVRRLNPLGDEVTDLYLAKMGAMVKGTVKGQFIIASVQGVLGAVSIYIAGFHNGFFIFAIFLTALSVIPLGSGIVTIPVGIGMILFGNIVGGLFVVLFHILGTTNIDNFLRPILVPREARLDSALMLLAVFSGIAMFGIWGIVLGPVLMIIIVTTISVYLAVYKGVEMTVDEPPEKRRRLFRRRIRAEVAAAADGGPSVD
ncbi:AI-2E family transporter [Candidatus Mycolicibacterium alkanivorans]|uniref:AI-2E family transporter n=1 Tax=Candidatus Mycolicibacterium alkanivorans TaxID=2954114 RepID=A0ABS9YUP7_9MYCO|nr:AI-2E family transporter [Candidatus Mycolicibacterium alkanivorans]MCI4674843.1 AI-2E family transporter [Candidatus Mycolicibacterium alkanivorans]